MINGSQEEAAAPVFFLSYARTRPPDNLVHTPYDSNEHVKQFFADMNRVVKDLVVLPTGLDPGFVDMTMAGGEIWVEELLWAVGSCQVFVALLSPNYVARKGWCPREWDAFTRRTVSPRVGQAKGRRTAILPVIWVPVPGQVPKTIARVQRFTVLNTPDPRAMAQYAEHGLLGLLWNDLDKVYRQIVWALGCRIQRMCDENLVAPNVISDYAELRDSFDDEGGEGG